jgi:hypothetical protein
MSADTDYLINWCALPAWCANCQGCMPRPAPVRSGGELFCSRHCAGRHRRPLCIDGREYRRRRQARKKRRR